MKIVQVSTWDVPCGIAAYTKALRSAIQKVSVNCDVLPIEESRMKYMTSDEIKEYLKFIAEKLSGYDVIHIQHEFSFFTGSYGLVGSIQYFHYFLKALIKYKKPIVVTFHTEPYFFQNFSGFKGLITKKILRAWWQYYIAKLFTAKNKLTAIVHTKTTRRIFLDSGFAKETVHILKQGVTFSPDTQSIDDHEKLLIKKQMGFPDDAIILSMFGFISTYKGYLTALNAMKVLPDNYYLLIIGSPHPNAEDAALDKIIGFIEEEKTAEPTRNLYARVKLTGYLSFDEVRYYQKITDISLSPYIGGTTISSSAALTWALSSGKPVIASKIPSFKELNEENNCLYLFTPDCANELAYTIQNMKLDSQKNTDIVINGMKYCEMNQWSNVAKKHIDLYQKLSSSVS
ncbi:MAG: glycosyltransferase [Limnothrix sp. RL_2_0]|nr:glycosyltransferase [Limnothrix sp. RL_2_0]